MFRKLTTWVLFILLEVCISAPSASDKTAPGTITPQALITARPQPHVPGTASNAIKTMNSFVESIQNEERPQDKENLGKKFGSLKVSPEPKIF